MEVVAYERDHTFATLSRFGPFELHTRTDIVSVGERRTRLDLEIDTRASGVLRLLLPAMRGRFRRTMAASLRTIKDEVER